MCCMHSVMAAQVLAPALLWCELALHGGITDVYIGESPVCKLSFL